MKSNLSTRHYKSRQWQKFLFDALCLVKLLFRLTLLREVEYTRSESATFEIDKVVMTDTTAGPGFV